MNPIDGMLHSLVGDLPLLYGPFAFVRSVILMITVMLCRFNYTWKEVLQLSRRSTFNCPYHDINEFIYQVLLFLLRADLSNQLRGELERWTRVVA